MKDEHGCGKDFDIIVNGTHHPVPSDHVTFDEIANLAFPDKKRGELITYTVNYYNGAGRPGEGKLVNKFDENIKIKDGTVFNVTRTDRS